MLRRLVVTSVTSILLSIAHPPVAIGQAGIITAIAGTLIPAISKEAEKFWKPKQNDTEVKAKQAEFDKAAQEVRKQVLAPFAIEAENIARVREAFDVAQMMHGAVAGMAAFSSPRLLNTLRASGDVATKKAVAAEFYQHWLSLKPLIGRAQALSASGIEPNLRADLQRDVTQMQLAVNSIDAGLNIPAQLQDTVMMALFITSATSGEADRVLNAMTFLTRDIENLRQGIADLALLLSVRAAAFEDAIRKATK